MTAPTVIRTGATGLQGSSEIAFGESCDLSRDAHFYGRVIERIHASRDLLEQIPLLPALAGMRVEPAERAEEHLPAHARGGAKPDDRRDLLQLQADGRARENGAQR